MLYMHYGYDIVQYLHWKVSHFSLPSLIASSTIMIIIHKNFTCKLILKLILY